LAAIFHSIIAETFIYLFITVNLCQPDDSLTANVIGYLGSFLKVNFRVGLKKTIEYFLLLPGKKIQFTEHLCYYGCYGNWIYI